MFLIKDKLIIRDGSRAARTSKMERFVIIVNSWKPLTIITKRSILDVAAALDPPLIIKSGQQSKKAVRLQHLLYETFLAKNAGTC